MKRLELQFYDEDDKTFTLAIDHPLDEQEPDKINEVMDQIIAQNVFVSKNGSIIGKKGARIVERNVTDIDLGIEE